MKTCVLFPKAFTYNYMNGSAAHSLDVPSSYELYLNPDELASSNGIRPNIRSGLSLFRHGKSEAKSERNKPKLLHVDDSPQIRLLVSIFLKNEFEVESVDSAEQALKALKEKNFDLILMDINLGTGIDGFEASSMIREDNNSKSIPIIALTTNEYSQVRKQCISSRINAYIQKPFDKSYLLGTLHEIYKHLEKNKSRKFEL
ncbi:MAG: response regulator [Balneolaceae bacterium]|nr:MAG: response regulator [Balneolaceae bacterium]